MSFTDLFSPTFLMFLGILVLIISLLVVFFENKMREQNHKIASMLSLVTTLADDMNETKIKLNYITSKFSNDKFNLNNLEDSIFPSTSENKLINVSDDESEKGLKLKESVFVSDSFSDSDTDSNSEVSDSDSDSDSDTDDDNESDDGIILRENKDDLNSIKVLKLDETNNLENFLPENLENLDNIDDDVLEQELIEEINEEPVQELELEQELEQEQELDQELNQTHEIDTSTHFDISPSELKSININLEDVPQTENNVEFKKLPLAKLKSIASERGLLTNLDASKLKKNELLKLLGIE
jgi:hypothetical protein